jgi:hypothetical protein
VQRKPTPQINKNAPSAARPELRCEEVVFMVEFVYLSFGNPLSSGRNPHTDSPLCEITPDMHFVCGNETAPAHTTP